MSRRFKLVFMLLTVVLVAMFATSIGLTAAIWTSGGAGSGNNTVAPAVDSPVDWNPWAKYFDGVIVNENTLSARITSFNTDDYTLNLERVIIPDHISIGDATYTVVELGNGLFANVTLKEQAVTVYVSPQVSRVCAMAFSNLPNLRKVVFGVSEDGIGADCVLEDFAFAACVSLESVVLNGRTLKDANGATISSAGGNAFAGCAGGLVIS